MLEMNEMRGGNIIKLNILYRPSIFFFIDRILETTNQPRSVIQFSRGAAHHITLYYITLHYIIVISYAIYN